MWELVNKRLKLMGQAVFKRIQFPCNYFWGKLAGIRVGMQPAIPYYYSLRRRHPSSQMLTLSSGIISGADFRALPRATPVTRLLWSPIIFSSFALTPEINPEANKYYFSPSLLPCGFLELMGHIWLIFGHHVFQRCWINICLCGGPLL